MTNIIISFFEGELAKLKAAIAPVEQTVVTDAEAIGKAALSYIESNGLKALYAIAVSALAGAVTGTPWATLSATVLSQGEAAGISIAKGAETIVLGQAQADLLAAGTLVAPTTGAVIANPAAVVVPPAA